MTQGNINRLVDILAARRSYRNVLDDPVVQKDLELIMNAIDSSTLDILNPIITGDEDFVLTGKGFGKNDIKEVMGTVDIVAPSAEGLKPHKFQFTKNKSLIVEISQLGQQKYESLIEGVKGKKTEDYENHLRKLKMFSAHLGKAPAIALVYRRPEDFLLFDDQLQKDIVFNDENLKKAAQMVLECGSITQSVAAAIFTFTLLANTLGYGSCWMTAPMLIKNEIAQRMSVEEGWEPIAIITIGLKRVSKSPNKPDDKKKRDYTSDFKLW